MGGGDSGSAAASQAAAQQAQQEAQIAAGTSAIDNTFNSTFTPDYYSGIQKDYLNYETPQLDDQYSTAKNALTMQLADQGNLNSSAGAYQYGQLSNRYNSALTTLNDNALSTADNLQSSVAAARQNLYNSLNQSGSAGAATTGAVDQAAALSQPQTFSPLGQLFGDVLQAGQSQANLERGAAAGYGGSPLYTTGLFTNPASVSVTNG